MQQLTDTPDISVRTFEDMAVAVIHAGTMHWRPDFDPGQDWHRDAEVDDDGLAVLGINGMVATLPGAVVVIDPNALTAADAPSTASLQIGSPVQAGLAALGVTPDDVTHVLITHGHFDHFTGLLEPRDSDHLVFAAAQHYFPAADMPTDAAAGPHVDAVRDVMRVLQQAQRLTLVEGDLEVADGVSLLSAPGESPGHQVIRLSSGPESVYYLGDLVHFPVEIDHPDWVPLKNRDLPTLIRSRIRVYGDAQEREATLVFTHAPFPAWGRILATGPENWRWESSPQQAARM